MQGTFSGNEEHGRWKAQEITGDPYSLQLTFVFPDWAGRYENPSFGTFVESVVREETPVHLAAEIRWMPQATMQQFDRSYRHHLALLKRR